MDLMGSQSLNANQNMHDSPQQQKRPRTGPFRGPSRAKKYKKLRLHQPRKLYVHIPPELGAAVGDKAKQFVAECSDWVRMFCRLDVVSWHGQPKDVVDRLYDTIKKKSETNRRNAKANKIKSACGAKSSARILYEMGVGKSAEMEVTPASNVQCEGNTEINASNATASNATAATASTSTTSAEPIYVKAWDKLKRHADGKLDEEAELKLLKFQELHERQIREKGMDNLSVQEAFVEVLGYRPGYARGLGKGAPAIPKGKKTVAALESDLQQLRSHESELLEKVNRMEAEAREREE